MTSSSARLLPANSWCTLTLRAESAARTALFARGPIPARFTPAGDDQQVHAQAGEAWRLLRQAAEEQRPLP